MLVIVAIDQVRIRNGRRLNKAIVIWLILLVATVLDLDHREHGLLCRCLERWDLTRRPDQFRRRFDTVLLAALLLIEARRAEGLLRARELLRRNKVVQLQVSVHNFDRSPIFLEEFNVR